KRKTPEGGQEAATRLTPSRLRLGRGMRGHYVQRHVPMRKDLASVSICCLETLAAILSKRRGVPGVCVVTFTLFSPNALERNLTSWSNFLKNRGHIKEFQTTIILSHSGGGFILPETPGAQSSWEYLLPFLFLLKVLVTF
ncbi:MAG: hypothetical protein C7B43_19895, partial [Sulfobacillus benefaciens]